MIAVVYTHCHSAVGEPLDSLNGASFLVLRNIVNFPVYMFFFLSGYFLKPIDNVKDFYRNRLSKLIPPYLFYTIVYYLGINVIKGQSISVKSIVSALFLGTAAPPLYYIVVLVYFTLLAPFLQKAVNNKPISFIILLSTPVFISISYVIQLMGTDVSKYLKYTPVWLSFYYVGMIFKVHRPVFKINNLWLLLVLSFVSELASTIALKHTELNEYSQLRFAAALYSIIIIMISYEYSHNRSLSDGCKLIVRLGDDSYAIYYMHFAFIVLFSAVIPFKTTYFLPLYQFGQLVFAVLMSEIAIVLIKKLIIHKKVRRLFGI